MFVKYLWSDNVINILEIGKEASYVSFPEFLCLKAEMMCPLPILWSYCQNVFPSQS